MTTTDRSGIAQRIDAMAVTAVSTPKGKRVDLHVYLYPDGGSALNAGTVSGGLVSDDLELLSEIALVIRRVRLAQAEEVKS
jgi:hypothetical protein